MNIPLYQIDAFAEHLFTGNPAAVCVLQEWISIELMQSIAEENNLSETAFIKQTGDQFAIRWFTPKHEVDLCGHATLAAAHVIIKHLKVLDSNQIVFTTEKRGNLVATAHGDDQYQLDFPAIPLTTIANPPQALLSAFDIQPQQVYAELDYVLVYDNEQQVRNMQVDGSLLLSLDRRGVVITAPGENVDFVSRCFYPKYNVTEDPVTGSAHSMLIPLWANKMGKNKLTAYQASKRGGDIIGELKNDRVLLQGRALTYLLGYIDV